MADATLQYRFRGAVQPSASIKRPVRAERPAAAAPGLGVLHLNDVIDDWGGDWGISAREFNAALNDLGDVSEIKLMINSPGGSVCEGIAIMNQLRRHPARVTAVVDGLAASAASFIAVAADELVMGENTELMIHKAWGLTIGNDDDHFAMGQRLLDLSTNIASIYAKKTGGTVDQFLAAMTAETWYSAEEAVAAGLADRVEGVDDPGPVDAFDLGVFRYQGRASAPVPDLSAPDDGRERRQRQNQNRLRLAHLRATAATHGKERHAHSG